MTASTLLFASAMAFVASAAFAYVGRALLQRPVSGEGRHAVVLFSGWWFGIAAFGFIGGGVLNVLAAVGLTDPAVFAAARSVGLVVLCASLWAVTSYFTFLLTGRRWPEYALAAFYVLAYALVMHHFAPLQAVDVSVRAWDTRVEYEPDAYTPRFGVLALLLGVPQGVGALAYLTLAFRVRDPTTRYRIALVGGSLLLWFASTAFANVVEDETLKFVARPFLGLLAAASVVLAYRPPAWVRERLGVRGLADAAG